MTEAADKTTWTPPPAECPKVTRLTNSRHVRRLLARLTEQLWSGAIDPKTANAICYSLGTAARVINDEQVLALGKRIAALEDRAAPRPPSSARRYLNG